MLDATVFLVTSFKTSAQSWTVLSLVHTSSWLPRLDVSSSALYFAFLFLLFSLMELLLPGWSQWHLFLFLQFIFIGSLFLQTTLRLLCLVLEVFQSLALTSFPSLTSHCASSCNFCLGCSQLLAVLCMLRFLFLCSCPALKWKCLVLSVNATYPSSFFQVTFFVKLSLLVLAISLL